MVLVVCEGKTEEALLKNLNSAGQKLNLVVHGGVGVPKTVVERAKQEQRRYRKKKLKIGEVWVVFDRDDHPCFREAMVQSRDLGFLTAISVPCVELWGILLYQDQTATLTNREAQHALKTLMRGYDHGRGARFTAEALDPERVTRAKRRAISLEKRAVDAGNRFYNPTTSFWKVVERLRG